MLVPPIHTSSLPRLSKLEFRVKTFKEFKQFVYLLIMAVEMFKTMQRGRGLAKCVWRNSLGFMTVNEPNSKECYLTSEIRFEIFAE